MPNLSFIPATRWTDRRQVRGLRGELVALSYLVSCGWEIEAHRFRMGRHDVDLVARRDTTVAFIEVKTRKSAECGAPAEAVSARKQAILGKVAACWQVSFGRPGDVYRFDLVSVWERSPGGASVEHVPDAWRL